MALSTVTFRAALGLATALLHISCADDAVPPQEQAGPSSASDAVAMAARENQIDERLLLSAAFVESNFGNDSEFNKTAASDDGVKRSPLFSMQTDALEGIPPDNILQNSRVLAAKIREYAGGSTDTFEWLRATAQAIVGDMDQEPTAKTAAQQIVLGELIHAYNSGFATYIEGQLVKVDPAPADKAIDSRALSQRSQRELPNYFYEADFGKRNLLGNKEAQKGDKTFDNTPRVILRWCPASTLKCFEYLRKTKDAATHYMSFVGPTGERQFLKMHENAKDLMWYGKQVENAISITFTGLAGTTRDTLRLDWMDWSDYAAIKRTVEEVAFNLKGREEEPASGEALRNLVVETGVSGRSATHSHPSTPDGKQNFALPLAWDSELFNQLMAQTLESRLETGILIEKPENAKNYEGTRVDLIISPDPDTARMEIFQDNPAGFDADGRPVHKNLWMTAINEDWGREVYEKSFNFPRIGIMGNKMRAIKVVSRDINNNIISSSIVRFVVDGIK